MNDASSNKLDILGIRGIPANHGGFETFAENLALFLQQKGILVRVFCQESGKFGIKKDEWKGVERILISIPVKGALGTILFDFLAILISLPKKSKKLVLGYNTAVFLVLLKLRRSSTLIINMDGIEWKRSKWGVIAKTWLRINEAIAMYVSDIVVADNPGIEQHLSSYSSRKKINMIPYGAKPAPIKVTSEITKQLNLNDEKYCLVVARPEPENSILEIVKGFNQLQGQTKLLILGNYSSVNAYHKLVQQNSGPNVIFAGAIYQENHLQALRSGASVYIHGHQVGGTNPSLVEAMAFDVPIVCHDNLFNRWVTGNKAYFFSNQDELLDALRHSLADQNNQSLIARFRKCFTWDVVLKSYYNLIFGR